MRLLPLTITRVLALVGLVGLSGCAVTDLPTAPGAARVALATPSGILRPPPVTQLLLEQAAAGLLYASESDYPFTYYFHPGPVPSPLAVAAFRATLAIPAETPVEVISLDEFFARHIERVDPGDSVAVALVPRYVILRETIRLVVREPVVFRVGRIAIDCYVVGTDRDGNLVGLTTVAIET